MASFSLPNPPAQYSRDWGNQYTLALELQVQNLWSQLQQLQFNIAPNYTTVSKNLLPDKAGQVIFDTDLGKLCVNTGSGWEIVTSV